MGDGSFVTVRRGVEHPTKIAFKRHALEKQDYRNLSEENWDHWDVALDAAKTILDSYLSLRMIEPWDYRTGVSYFLRTQEDYSDYFQIRKFMQGKHVQWKPYLAAILGLDHEAVSRKYSIDEQIDDLTSRRKEREAEIDVTDHDRGAMASKIDILRDEIAAIDERLDGFDFSQEERRISKKVVEEVEVPDSRYQRGAL